MIYDQSNHINKYRVSPTKVIGQQTFIVVSPILTVKRIFVESKYYSKYWKNSQL